MKTFDFAYGSNFAGTMNQRGEGATRCGRLIALFGQED